MQRNIQSFTCSDLSTFIRSCLYWSDQFSHFSYFNPNDYDIREGPFLHFLGVSNTRIHSFSQDSFERLKNVYDQNNWLLGYFSYDLKNEIEDLKSENPTTVTMPHCCFFEPEHLIFFEEDRVSIHSYHDPKSVYDSILENSPYSEYNTYDEIVFNALISKEEYLNILKKIKRHIEAGDIYEVNYCIEFLAQKARLDPLQCFYELMEVTPMPFSTLQKIAGKYLISASPERFLKKIGNKLISQPMKGTIRRGYSDEEDVRLKEELIQSKKERAENMMIVDLVRHDLSRSSVPGTVHVEELFGISSFPNVHQMISTISAEIDPNTHLMDALRNAFPMGSMTGAPKIRAMELIEQYEKTARGWYSGAAGYFSPGGNFDFNVLIRSLIYDKNNQLLTYHAGSAITYESIPENEYDECVLKAETISHLFSIAK